MKFTLDDKRALRVVPITLGMLLLVLPCGPWGCGKTKEPHDVSRAAAQVDAQVDWSAARLIAVQDGMRYKTLESFARESFNDMTGRERLPGLTPVGSLMEWVFRRDAYVDVPLINVGNTPLREMLALHLPERDRQRVRETKRFTMRELGMPTIQQQLRSLATDSRKRNAVNRVLNAYALATRLDEFVRIVPQPGGSETSPWFTPPEVMGNLTQAQLAQMGLTRRDLPAEAQQPVPGVTPDQALDVTVTWSSLRAAWLRGDAPAVQRYIDRLEVNMPAMASAGVYPSRSQRWAEARYYAAGKFTYGWAFYFLGLLASVWAMLTRWRYWWWLSLVIIIGALGFHAYGVALRWYILGRIPVANMFEAIVSSAVVGVAIVLLIELFMRTRVLLVGTAALGFIFLLLGHFVVPGSNLGVIPGILDDIQLRLHTVMIITAYALSYVGAVVGLIYLSGYVGWAIRRGFSGAERAVAEPAVPIGALSFVGAQRPLLAGGSPGDEAGSGRVPQWLNDIDWAHLILINMIFILLFVGGIILGAWWADYSWGRPWGWDPKEVFAMNSWIIYAILIHLRFVVKQRGLWTAIFSILGCAVVTFNWFGVNFWISGLHSYA